MGTSCDRCECMERMRVLPMFWLLNISEAVGSANGCGRTHPTCKQCSRCDANTYQPMRCARFKCRAHERMHSKSCRNIIDTIRENRSAYGTTARYTAFWITPR